MYIQCNFGSKTLLLSFKRREGWESGKNGMKGISGSLVWLKIQIPVMRGLTSKLNQVAQGCVQWFQIPPRTKIVPTNVFVPLPAFDLPHWKGFPSLHSNKFLWISLSAFCVSFLSTLRCVLPSSLWLHFPCNRPHVVEDSSYFSLFPSLKGLSKHSYQFSHMSCLHHC